jgi:hypothetical protein
MTIRVGLQESLRRRVGGAEACFPMKIDRDHFRLVLPEPDWSDQSTDKGHDFRRGNSEQVLVVVHVAKVPLLPTELFDSVATLLKHRLKAAQDLSGNSCRFESPVVEELNPDLHVRVVGQDLRNNVFMQIGHFGTPEKVVVVSLYDYSGTRSLQEFRKRSDEVLATVEVR